MRPASRTLLALATMAMVAFLAVRSQVRDGDTYNGLIDRTRRLRELSGQLDSAALQAQAATIQHYDALTDAIREMRSVQDQMEQKIADHNDPGLTELVARTRASLRQKEALTDRFQSANSILRNSLSYLPAAARAASEQAVGSDGGRVQALIAALLGDVLLQRSRRAPEHAERVMAGLTALQAAHVEEGTLPSASVDGVLRHGRVVADYALKVDETMVLLLDTDNRSYDSLYLAIRQRREAAVGQANRYRAGLVAFSVVLLTTIGFMMLHLRRNARQLQDALGHLAHKTGLLEQKQGELTALNQDLEQRVVGRTSELAGSKEQYRLLLETTQTIPWEMEARALRFSYVGPQAGALLGFPVSAWTDEDFLARHLHPESREATLQQLGTCAENPGHHEVELRMVASDGRPVWLRAFVSTIVGPQAAAILRGILVDVTTQRRLEAELRSAQKLESVGRLAAGIAHEINTPVQFVGDSVHFVDGFFSGVGAVVAKYRALRAGVMRGEGQQVAAALAVEAQEAEETADLDYALENVPQALARSRDGLDRIATIVRSMKDFAHPDQKEKTAVDLNRNINSTLVIARSEYKEVAELDMQLGDIPAVWCHAGELNQVVLNIVVNAAHAISDVVAETGEKGRITVRTFVEGEEIVLAIGDSGAGIPAEQHERIFEPFFTTKEVGKGTGQGLAIARSVVDRHGGRISFQTELGKGTTFFVRLPVGSDGHGSDAIPLARAS